MELTIIETSAY